MVPLGLNAPQAIPVEVVSESPFFFQQVIGAFAQADSLFQLVDDFGQMTLAQGSAPDTDVAIIFAPQDHLQNSSAVPNALASGHSPPAIHSLRPSPARSW